MAFDRQFVAGLDGRVRFSDLRTAAGDQRIVAQDGVSAFALNRHIHVGAAEIAHVPVVIVEQVEHFVREIPSFIPIAFFDSKVPGTNYLSFIGQDSFQSGFVSARLMKLLVPEGGTVAIINILPQYYHIDERIRGFLAFFEGDARYDLKTFFLDIRKEDDESDRLCRSIFDETRDVKGFFIPCGHVSRFARYIHANNLQGKTHVVGYDLIQQNREYLKNGTIDFIISQSPEVQGYQGIYSLYRYCVLKETPQKETILPIDIITKENMDYF